MFPVYRPISPIPFSQTSKSVRIARNRATQRRDSPEVASTGASVHEDELAQIEENTAEVLEAVFGGKGSQILEFGGSGIATGG